MYMKCKYQSNYRSPSSFSVPGTLSYISFCFLKSQCSLIIISPISIGNLFLCSSIPDILSNHSISHCISNSLMLSQTLHKPVSVPPYQRISALHGRPPAGDASCGSLFCIIAFLKCCIR